VGIVSLLLFAFRVPATIYYVNATNPAPAAPFATWATAATNIQDAVDLTTSGDTVLVTNGVYAYGGLSVAGTLTNRIALTNAITVQSVNGPWVTTILGAGATNGPSAVRCAWLTNGAALIGFTLTGGATLNTGDQTTLLSGGGVWCASSNALVQNCVIFSNTAWSAGAGNYQGTIVGSLICSNGIQNINGGASSKSILKNCTIVGNACYGVVSPMSMTNCVIYFNTYLGGTVNYSAIGNSFSHCCTTPQLAGAGNFITAPQLLSDGAHLATNSPCIGAGVGLGAGTDIFGLAWSNPPSIGCAEWYPMPAIVAQPAIQFPVTGGLMIGTSVAGAPPFVCWWTKNGQPVQNDGHYSSADTTALLINNVSLSDAGAYQVVVSNAFGVVTSAVSQVSIHCVAGSGSAVPPYSDWNTAATNIQDAISVSQAGDIVLVTNGLYAFGGLALVGNLTNRVALNQAIMVQSVNGPWVTTIQGGNGTNGAPASRCAWLTNGAALVGFTLEGGRTQGGSPTVSNGGGVWCASSNAIVANCIICSNYCYNYGGGAYLGTLRNCAVYGNNSVYGGGSYYSYLINCTVTTNYASQGGGANQGGLTNCIIYNNRPDNIFNGGFLQVSYCCTYPLPLGGIGNFTNPPLVFVDNVHLSTNSPCISAGVNLGANADIDGRPWGNPPSIGCSEAPTAPLVGQPVTRLGGGPVGITITAPFTGSAPFSYWWLHDGAILTNSSQFISAQTSSLLVAGSSSSDAGAYQLVVSNSFGVVTSAVVQLVVHCVDAGGANPVSPYSSWATAATNIQDAIAASATGDIVLVTNGLYATGGISMDGIITNRVSVNKAILLQSVNGADTTIVQGAWDPVSTNGPGAIRCAWLTTNAVMSGFTLRGGATQSAGSGGGVWGPLSNVTLTNFTPAAAVANCVIISNAAGNVGAGAYQVILNHCTLVTNTAINKGGGAASCYLINCMVSGNRAGDVFSAGWGGGLNYCMATNCAVTRNTAATSGGGAYQSTLVNCTVTGNQVANQNGGGVATCVLLNSIVYLNQVLLFADSTSNSYNSSFSYSCTAPAVTGVGNIASDPLLLVDGIHLSASSPCIGAGNAPATSNTDIDGQSWNNPPSIGCDEWQPAPVIAVKPAFQIGTPAHGFTSRVTVAGQAPFAYLWSKDGVPILDDGHHSNSGTASLTVNNFGPEDAGLYQVVITNSSGAVTSAIVPLVIHVVDASSLNPEAPHFSWSTAAATIQDAINIAAPGDVVLVTNGLYATGGLVVAGDLTNRVALNKAITVISVNGYSTTTIQGVWDPVTTNGSGAVRCAYVGDGAVLNGFTLQNGATRAAGDAFSGGPLESGGGVYCNSTSGTVANCVLSNNSAIYGGGMANGTLNNSLVVYNQAYSQGGGAYYGTLNGCTVIDNASVFSGGGACYSLVRNSIVLYNSFITFGSSPLANNYLVGSSAFSYSCTTPVPPGTGNKYVDPVFLDLFHISSLSSCRGAGSPLYSSGADLDGESWNNPPSMGCDEVVASNLTGPLGVNIHSSATNLFVSRFDSFTGLFSGRPSYLSWSFGDGTVLTNGAGTVGHKWTNTGDYNVTFTAYNMDNPLGVSTNVVVSVQPFTIPQLQPTVSLTNGFGFQFAGQTNATYFVQYTTNLVPPVTWQTLQTIFYNTQNLIQFTDGSGTNMARFYRVSVQ